MPEIHPYYTTDHVQLVELTAETAAAWLVEYAAIRERMPIPQNEIQEQIMARQLETLDREQSALVALFQVEEEANNV